MGPGRSFELGAGDGFLGGLVQVVAGLVAVRGLGFGELGVRLDLVRVVGRLADPGPGVRDPERLPDRRASSEEAVGDEEGLLGAGFVVRDHGVGVVLGDELLDAAAVVVVRQLRDRLGFAKVLVDLHGEGVLALDRDVILGLDHFVAFVFPGPEFGAAVLRLASAVFDGDETVELDREFPENDV